MKNFMLPVTLTSGGQHAHFLPLSGEGLFIFPESDGAVVDKICSCVNHIAHKGGNAVAGNHVEAEVIFHIPEPGLIDEPHYKELQAVANGKPDKEECYLPSVFAAGAEHPVFIPNKGIDETYYIAYGVGYILINTEDGFTHEDGTECEHGIHTPHQGIFYKLYDGLR